MPTYIGFSTQNANQPIVFNTPGNQGGIGNVTVSPRLGKKFRLTDEQLVIRDLLNAFSIKQGDKVGNPGYGTTIWTYVFEPNTDDVRREMEAEVRRVAAQDPRIILNTVNIYARENGVLIQVEMAMSPFNNAVQMGFFLNRFDGSIQQLAQ